MCAHTLVHAFIYNIYIFFFKLNSRPRTMYATIHITAPNNIDKSRAPQAYELFKLSANRLPGFFYQNKLLTSLSD